MPMRICSYQFVEALLRNHGLDLADSITQCQLRCDDEFRFGLAFCLLFLFFALLLLLGVEHFVVDYLEDEALVALELLGWCIRNQEDTVFGQMGWLLSSILV